MSLFNIYSVFSFSVFLPFNILSSEIQLGLYTRLAVSLERGPTHSGPSQVCFPQRSAFRHLALLILFIPLFITLTPGLGHQHTSAAAWGLCMAGMASPNTNARAHRAEDRGVETRDERRGEERRGVIWPCLQAR